MTTETITYEDYRTNKHLRKKYHLHTCFDGLTNHSFWLEVPEGIQKEPHKTIFKYYDLDLEYRALGNYRTYQTLVFKCAYCAKRHFTTPKICQKCKHFINPVGKNIAKLLSGMFYKLTCRCKLYDNN